MVDFRVECLSVMYLKIYCLRQNEQYSVYNLNNIQAFMSIEKSDGLKFGNCFLNWA